MLPMTGGCSTYGPPHYVRKPLGSPFRCFLFSCQGLFNAVPRCTADRSQGGRFTRGNGGRDECQERKETTSLISSGLTTTTHDPFSTSSSTFGRHDVFETMKGLRYRHTHLGFFCLFPAAAAAAAAAGHARARPPPPDPDFEAKRETLTLRTLETSDT